MAGKAPLLRGVKSSARRSSRQVRARVADPDVQDGAVRPGGRCVSVLWVKAHRGPFGSKVCRTKRLQFADSGSAHSRHSEIQPQREQNGQEHGANLARALSERSEE